MGPLVDCRWPSCGPHRRHWLFFALFFVVSFFFYTSEVLSDWGPAQWFQNQTRALRAPSPKRGPVPAANANATCAPVVPYVSPGPYLVEYPYPYRFRINEPQACEEDPFVVLVVHVAPDNRAHRDVIRSTWGAERRVLDRSVKLLFLLGLQAGSEAQLLAESGAHRDLVQADFLDCYKNLTIKTMVMLDWLDSFCPRAAFAMKVDSDVFLNVDNLLRLLLGAPRAGYMTGLVARDAAVLRDPGSKWYLPEEVYPEPRYPRYALGLGYVLSLDLPRKLKGAALQVRALYIEDVYLGLCMQVLGLGPTDPPQGGYFHVAPLRYTRCGYSQIVASTTPPGTDRVGLWKDFKRPGRYC